MRQHGAAPVPRGSGACCLDAAFFAQPLFALRLKRADLFQLRFDVFALLDQLRAMVFEYLQKLHELRRFVALRNSN